MAPELKCWEGHHALYFYAVGVPHVVYIFRIANYCRCNYIHRKKGQMQHPRVLFRYGILFDGLRFKVVVATCHCLYKGRGGIHFLLVGGTPIMAMLFSNLVFTILLLAETIQRPWAVTEQKQKQENDNMDMIKRRRTSIVNIVKQSIGATINKTNLSQFSSLSIFLSLTV